ncbi:MAG: DUF4198 domain-containing protein [Verrucomicrobiota bacterium]
MKAYHSIAAISAVFLGFSAPAKAHRSWIVPSSTVLSGEEPWVTFDAAISNNLFFADHHAPELTAISAIGPDGEKEPLLNGSKGKYRTTFDLKLEKAGTYKVASVREMIMARWKEDGEEKSFRGSAGDFEKEKIAGKPGVSVTESSSRVETFVTKGEPSTGALKLTGKGLELEFAETHPNDLFAGGKAKFILKKDGKPAAGVTVTAIPGNDRYRSEAGEITATTGSNGEFEIVFKEAGRWWLNASLDGDGEGKKAEDSDKDSKAGKTEKSGADKSAQPTKRCSYTAVFEVLPE